MGKISESELFPGDSNERRSERGRWWAFVLYRDKPGHRQQYGGWQDWSEFSDNGIAVSGGSGDIDTEIDREWDDTWYARIGFAYDISDQSAYTFGVSYDSSPVNDKHRTFDLPVEEYYKLLMFGLVSAAYTWKGKNKLDFALGATLMMIGDAEIDQTSQGVRAAGKFDQNYILFSGGTVRYAF